MTNDNKGVRNRYKALRKKIVSLSPYIRRSRHERALARVTEYIQYERRAHEAMGRLFFSWPSPAWTAKVRRLVPVADAKVEELCLFVTHAAKPILKPHVIDHVAALLEQDVAVVLIANTDLEANSLQLPSVLVDRLHGFIVRQNVGYDFGAWAHAYSMINPSFVHRRLFLINDSIVGPLDRGAYRDLLGRVRQSGADLLGLTSHPDPHDHLQSYYLVVKDRLLHSEVFDSFMRHVVNMPRKESVIDCYELWMSTFFAHQGFAVDALFPNVSTDPPMKRNDTLWRWRELVELGFPFIKSAVLANSEHADEARSMLPSVYTNQGSDLRMLGG